MNVNRIVCKTFGEVWKKYFEMEILGDEFVISDVDQIAIRFVRWNGRVKQNYSLNSLAQFCVQQYDPLRMYIKYQIKMNVCDFLVVSKTGWWVKYWIWSFESIMERQIKISLQLYVSADKSVS